MSSQKNQGDSPILILTTVLYDQHLGQETAIRIPVKEGERILGQVVDLFVPKLWAAIYRITSKVRKGEFLGPADTAVVSALTLLSEVSLSEKYADNLTPGEKPALRWKDGGWVVIATTYSNHANCLPER